MKQPIPTLMCITIFYCWMWICLRCLNMQLDFSIFTGLEAPVFLKDKDLTSYLYF